jgi:hypothetical protein
LIKKAIGRNKQSNQLTKEDLYSFIRLNSLEECIQYMKVMLDFYYIGININSTNKDPSEIDSDRDLWLQTMASKGCHFLALLHGVDYSTNTGRLKPIIDFSILFTIARRMYESLIAFELIFVLPKTKEQQIIIYNLFKAHGLAERLKDLSEEMKRRNPKRILEEQEDIEKCRKEIQETNLYKNMNKDTLNVINNAFGNRFRYRFKEDNTMELIGFEKAHTLLRVKDDYYNNNYSFFSLHGHPSYLSLIQFRDAYKSESRADIIIAKHATQCVLSFLSIYIIDYMKLNAKVKDAYDSLEMPRRFAIGLYEDAMREEHKFR